MIIQIVLTVLLALVLGYAWLSFRRMRHVALVMAVIALAGIYFVWLPDQSTRLAHWVGIGRGADLIVYLWMALSLLVILNIHLQLRAQFEIVTLLVRRLALLEAERAETRSDDTGLE